MASLRDSDQQLQQQPKRMGYRKKDINKKEAEIVVVLKNLKEKRDKVDVTLPDHKESPLVIKINGVVFLEKVLPAAITVQKSKYKVKYGEKGEVKVKLHKVDADYWMHRWSPSRDQAGSAASPVHSLDQSRSASSLGSHSSPTSHVPRSPSTASRTSHSDGPIITLLE